MLAFVPATSWREERFKTVESGTVIPRKGEQRLLRVVPDMKVSSKTISRRVIRDVQVRPTMVPRVAMGTLPDAAT